MQGTEAVSYTHLGDEEVGYIANITDSTTIGFKYFDCHDIREISIWTRGYARCV